MSGSFNNKGFGADGKLSEAYMWLTGADRQRAIQDALNGVTGFNAVDDGHSMTLAQYLDSQKGADGTYATGITRSRDNRESPWVDTTNYGGTREQLKKALGFNPDDDESINVTTAPTSANPFMGVAGTRDLSVLRTSKLDPKDSNFVQAGDLDNHWLGELLTGMGGHGLYAQLGIQNDPQAQGALNAKLFHYDPNLGLLVDKNIVSAVNQMKENDHPGFFQKPAIQALLKVGTAMIPGAGPALSAGLSGAFALGNGASFGNALKAAGTSYIGNQAGLFAMDKVGNSLFNNFGLSGLSDTAGNAIVSGARGISSNAAQQFIGTGRINLGQLATSGISGAASGGIQGAFGDSPLSHLGQNGVSQLINNRGRFNRINLASLAGTGAGWAASQYWPRWPN
jgi:hypothetical protein